MKKYLLWISIVAIFVLSACSVKNSELVSKVEPTTSKGVTDLKYKDLLSETTIHDAVRANDLKMVEFFIEQKIDLNEKDRFGYTPLHLASRFNHYDIAQKLIENKAEINSLDKYGDSPLLDSTRNGYTKMSKLLICNGAKRDILDKYKMSPLHYASKTNDIEIAKLLRAENVMEQCAEKVEAKVIPEEEVFLKLISIDNYNIINDNTPEICGDILDSDVQFVQLSFDGGKTVTDARMNGNRWCAQVVNKLENGDYTAMAMAINSKKQRGKAQDDLTIHVLNDLYSALNEEFSPDFPTWNAELDEDTLTFRFKNPALIFQRGSSQIKAQYREILNNFFPRYLKILDDYKDQIVNVHIEGHTSSRYRSAKTIEEKFEKNRVLSQKRADEVLGFLSQINNAEVLKSRDFVDNSFVAEGMSSSEPILNEDGTENMELSRRVEFRIETTPNE